MQMTPKLARRSRAQSIVETVVGIMFLVPVVLFLLDVAVLVIANSANDNLAKSACRAAASAMDSTLNPPVGTFTKAQEAATAVCSNFATSSIIQAPGPSPNGAKILTGFYFNSPTGQGGNWPGPLQAGQATPPQPVSGQVGCITSMFVSLPVPFPGFTTFTFLAQDVEPIVSVAP